jgi:hypothetical protein
MTQAFNLSQFANKLNSSGQTDNTGLQNSSVTVTAGTGMSGGGSVSLGGSTTLTNAGVTSLTAGTGISVSGSTGGVTVTNSQPFSGSTKQLCKAWVSIDASGSIIGGSSAGSYNVSSVTKNGTGDFTVTYSTALPNTNYCIVTTCGKSTGGSTTTAIVNYTSSYTEQAPTTTTTRFSLQQYNGALSDSNYSYLAIFSS